MSDESSEQPVESQDNDALSTPSLDDVVPDDASELIEHDINALVAERDQFKDIALRLQADFENYKKRVNTQLSDETNRATGRLVEAIYGAYFDTIHVFALHAGVGHDVGHGPSGGSSTVFRRRCDRADQKGQPRPG